MAYPVVAGKGEEIANFINGKVVGSSICEHNRKSSKCKECLGSSICKHDRQISQCKECLGSGICPHTPGTTWGAWWCLEALRDS